MTLTSDGLRQLRELCERATPDVLAALRSCIEQYVAAWYINADGSEAKPRPDSPVLAMVELANAARSALPTLIDEVVRLRAENAALRKLATMTDYDLNADEAP